VFSLQSSEFWAGINDLLSAILPVLRSPTEEGNLESLGFSGAVTQHLSENVKFLLDLLFHLQSSCRLYV
jgi:hypothetical protein